MFFFPRCVNIAAVVGRSAKRSAIRLWTLRSKRILKKNWRILGANCGYSRGGAKRFDRKDFGYLKEKYKDSQDGDTLPETNIVSENRPSQKEMTSSNHWFSGAIYVSFREGLWYFFHAEVMSERCHQIKASVFLYCSYYHLEISANRLHD